MSIVKNTNSGKLQGFRTTDHIASFLDSTLHLDLPSFDTAEMLACLKKLVAVDRDWFDFNEEVD